MPSHFIPLAFSSLSWHSAIIPILKVLGSPGEHEPLDTKLIAVHLRTSVALPLYADDKILSSFGAVLQHVELHGHYFLMNSECNASSSEAFAFTLFHGTPSFFQLFSLSKLVIDRIFSATWNTFYELL